MLTHERLLELLHYDPETGVWTWRVSRGCVGAGTQAGSTAASHGRREIKIEQRSYLSSRLAHFYMTQTWPEQLIDHHNGDVLNDRWDNLRKATHTQNQHNKVASSKSRTGIKGVRLCRGRYRADAKVQGRQLYLGSYGTADEAEAAYSAHEAKHHGEFARSNRQQPCPPIHSSDLPTISSPPLQSASTNQQNDAPIDRL